MGVSLHEDPRVTVRTKRQIRSARKLRALGQAEARRSPARPAPVFVYGNPARCRRYPRSVVECRATADGEVWMDLCVSSTPSVTWIRLTRF